MSRPSSIIRPAAGLYLPLHATLRGRVRWQVLDERGVPEVPRTPSGVAITTADGVDQPNLILNQGLDQIVTADCLGFSISTQNWRNSLAVGTGSTAPAVGDTGLVAEVQRAASSGTLATGSLTEELDTGDDVFRSTIVCNRVVTMNADRNLTEYGFSHLAAAAANLSIRELLRDGVGTPVTISLLNGKSLAVLHTLTIEIAAPTAGTAATIDLDAYDAANALISTTPFDVIHGPYVVADNAAPLTRFFRAWNPYVTSGMSVAAHTAAQAYARVTGNSGYSQVDAATVAVEAYSTGTYQRAKRGTLGTGQANGAIYGFRTRQGSGVAQNAWWAGFDVWFDSPASYTKVNTDTLRVGVVSTWARA